MSSSCFFIKFLLIPFKDINDHTTDPDTTDWIHANADFNIVQGIDIGVYNLVECNFRRYIDTTIIVTRVVYRDFFREWNTKLVLRHRDLNSSWLYIAASVSQKSLMWDLIVDALWLKLRHSFAIRNKVKPLFETVSRALIGYETRINLSFIS